MADHGLTKDDLRAAVSAGTISESQAASVLALSEARRGVRENIDGLNEPFELFKGFNEIFIVVGLGILFAGYVGVAAIIGAALIGQVTALAAIWGLSRYFIRTRRMVAPAIALALMFSSTAGALGFTIADMFAPDPLNLNDLDAFINYNAAYMPISATVAAIAMAGFWYAYRVPFALFLISISVFMAIFGFTSVGGAEFDSFEQIFLLTSQGPFSVITIALGFVALLLALRFDMSDPHRVTLNASNAFWLHVIAAPAIVNTVAMTLFSIGSSTALIGVFVFVLLMAIFAIAIDRRSFLISGVGYIVALAFTVIEGQAFTIIMILGAVLVLLGAKWEVWRGRIMRTLPEFPGKDRLPPWDQQKDTK